MVGPCAFCVCGDRGLPNAAASAWGSSRPAVPLARTARHGLHRARLLLSLSLSAAAAWSGSSSQYRQPRGPTKGAKPPRWRRQVRRSSSALRMNRGVAHHVGVGRCLHYEITWYQAVWRRGQVDQDFRPGRLTELLPSAEDEWDGQGAGATSRRVGARDPRRR